MPPRKILIALPGAMLQKIDHIAECEHRTRSDLVREALRRYLEGFYQKQSLLNAAPTENVHQLSS